MFFNLYTAASHTMLYAAQVLEYVPFAIERSAATVYTYSEAQVFRLLLFPNSTYLLLHISCEDNGFFLV